MTSDKIPTPLIPSIVPVGTVVAYAGNNIPSGWLLCDGSVVNQSQYEALSNVIGTFWGNGDHSFGSFNLPDMRGMFLRGVDGGKNDPDVSSRISINGGNSTGVGSKQEDAFQGHYHDVDSYVHDSGQPGPIKSWAQPGVYDSKLTFYNHTNCTATNIIKDDSNVTPRVAKETRPKNVYVYYIIKY